MEQINQNYEEQVGIVQWYIDHFKNRMNIEMKQPDFEPNATQEHDGYDGVNTELRKNLDTMGINKTEIFMWSEQTHRLLRLCTHVKNVQSFSKDQLYHTLIGGTRKPYHDPRTDEFNDDITKNLQVEDLLDSRLLAELLLKEREKLEKIKIVENIIYDYRTKYQNTNKKDHNLMNELINNLQNISILPYIWLISWENRENFYNNILTEKERKDNNLIDEYSIRKYLESDPVYAILTWSTPDPNMKQIIDDKKLSELLVEILQ